jgi:hypothetical protein
MLSCSHYYKLNLKITNLIYAYNLITPKHLQLSLVLYANSGPVYTMLNLGAMYRLPDMGVIYMYNIPTK